MRLLVFVSAVACGGQIIAPAVDAAVTDASVIDAAVDVDAEVASPRDGSVRCGHQSYAPAWCAPSTQYCLETGFYENDPTAFGRCFALPAACIVDVSCACLEDAGIPTCSDCVVEDSGLVRIGCFDP